MEKYKEAASRKQGVDAPGDPKVTTDQLRVVRLANKVVAKGDVFLLSEARSLYLREIAKRVRKQTLREKERILATFAGWLGPDVEVTAVSKAEAGRYVSEVLTQRDYAVKTIRDTIGHLSAFFAWLEGRGRIEFNPWRGVAGTVRDTTRGTKPKRRPWTDAELHKLLEGILETDPLWPMVAIAAYSGMRREEIASLKVGDVTEKAFNVTEGKTEAALRAIPMHPVLVDLVARLKRQSGDGFLIPWLLRGGTDEKRGHYVGKRFSHVKVRLGFKDEALNFHTLRNAFMQRCEEAGVPESTVKLLVGHSRPSLTFGRYSPGVAFESLTRAVARVTFGTLDSLVKAKSRSIEVSRSQSRRYVRALR